MGDLLLGFGIFVALGVVLMVAGLIGARLIVWVVEKKRWL